MAADRPKTAPHGEKTIELTVRFWTDDIAPRKGQVVPKHAWTHGTVRPVTNATHGITRGKAVPFNSLMEIGRAIEKALIAQGVSLHPNTTMQKYLRPKKPANG